MTKAEQRAISAMRIIAAEAINKAKSGHPGLAIGSAPAAYTLWRTMKHDPKHPCWPGRDRFVLSSGHASMLEYTLLHFFGYGLSMEDIKSFRQWGSITPGHPEWKHTKGVEATTGPLGQGFAMSVGMAMAEKHLAARFNRPGFEVFDNRTYCIMGDGCMMEGISSEAASLAGTLKLGKLIAMYDSNRISIEGDTDITFTEDVAARFRAFDWQVIDVPDGEDMTAVAEALELARVETDKPSLIIYHTVIGHGAPQEGTAKVHGAPIGAEGVEEMKKRFGWECETPFEVPADVYEHFEDITSNMHTAREAWEAMYEAYKLAYPELAAELERERAGELPDLENDESFWQFDGAMATRKSSGIALNRLAEIMPNLFGGAADLSPSTLTTLKNSGSFSADNPEGNNIHWGVRELAMASACNGVALYGCLRPFLATFFVFSDYVKPALRLSAIMGLPVLCILTHDSIGVGEDGPTHQPIEQLASLRATPNVMVFRPADAREVAAGYIASLRRTQGPTVLALSRQNLPPMENSGKGALKGGYVVRDPKGGYDVILIASGSELEPALKAADILAVSGKTARVVSLPCFELFEQQSEEYKESVLPKASRKRVVVEAACPFGLDRYAGLDGRVVAIHGFGSSAPYAKLMEEYGFTGENIAKIAMELIIGG